MGWKVFASELDRSSSHKFFECYADNTADNFENPPNKCIEAATSEIFM